MMMKHVSSAAWCLAVALVAPALTVQLQAANAQDIEVDRIMEEVVVTGSRIRRNPLTEAAPIMDISAAKLDETGITNLGDILQNLPIAGSAPNSKFNVPGNIGFPQDGAGIGAGAVKLSLRNIGDKRTLILVDGKRWVAGASASGVPSTVDLNTLPANVIKRIEILQDGASAIYGSDAIGGVVNVITNSDFEGFRLDAQTGEYLSAGDGASAEIAGLWGGGNGTTHFVLSASYTEERGIETADRAMFAYPNLFATSCDVQPFSFCSSHTAQGRFVLGPNFGFLDITLNDGVLNDGMANVPTCDPSIPGDCTGSDWHAFTNADRFNYNGPGLNFLRTPNERVNIYGSVNHSLSDTLSLVMTAAYTNRSSATKGAPEPLCFGDGCGNRINDEFVVSAANIYNPFGVDLSSANGNLAFFGRRPLEAGPRRFIQDVNTLFISVGFEGEFEAGSRSFFWDLAASYGDNRGLQEKFGAFNAAKLQVAMGDPAVCAATPNCVPFNYFGGQGPDGEGSITQDMLDYVGYVQRDFSEQTLKDISFNITGDIFSLPGGDLAFAAGVEYREHDGSYRPDPIAASGETAGIRAGSTVGSFDVTEFYGELIIPLISGAALAENLEISLAARSSDYSTSGSESTYKAGVLWQPVGSLSVRGSFSTGFRAPGIGELFGGAAREDVGFQDPCLDYTAIVGSANGGRDTPQPAHIQANCATLGVPPGLNFSSGPAFSQGNTALIPETSDSWSAGFVWSPTFARNAGWSDGITISIDYFDLQIDDAIQGRDPVEVLIACVETLDQFFCDLVPRSPSGGIEFIDNQLQNIGSVETSGFDIAISYVAPETRLGQFSLDVNATHLNEYIERTLKTDGSFFSADRTGTETFETFARAFPDWRAVTNVGWNKDRWSANLAFRWADKLTLPNGCEGFTPMGGSAILESVMFTDLQIRYDPSFAGDALTLAVGFNNLFDESPVNLPCEIGPSQVLHDLPGTVGYIRVTYQRD